jgi:hypothetical protein
MINLHTILEERSTRGCAMSKDPISKGGQDVSRRRLLEKTALAVGAATSVVAARTALARSSDVVMDSAGRVLIQGAALRTQRPEGCFETAASENDKCINQYSCAGTTNRGGCSNEKTCIAPSRTLQQSTTGGAKVNTPVGGNALTGPKVNAPLSGNSLTSPKLNAPLGGNTRK